MVFPLPESDTRPFSGTGATDVQPAVRLHGVNPFRSPFIRCPVLPVQRSRCSPGFGPLQGVLPLRLRRRFRVFFLLRTKSRTSPKKVSAMYHRVSKNEEVGLPRKRGCRPSWGLCPCRLSRPFGVCSIVAYGFASKRGVRYRPLTTSLLIGLAPTEVNLDNRFGLNL